MKKIMGPGKGGSVLVHVGTSNGGGEGTTVIVRKYWQLVRTLEQVILLNLWGCFFGGLI